MKHIKTWLFLLLLLMSFSLFSQESIAMKEIYIDNSLAYRISNQQLFTGVAQSKRKNGHLVYDEKYVNGIITESNLYYNTKEKLISDKTMYYQQKPFVNEKRIRFHLSKDTLRIISYDTSGKKILIEEFENNRSIYSCEYDGRKKNGKEICIDKNGEKLVFEYRDGKKIK